MHKENWVKAVILILMAIFCLGCTDGVDGKIDYETFKKITGSPPFGLSEYKDKDGTKYLIVRTKQGRGEGVCIIKK